MKYVSDEDIYKHYLGHKISLSKSIISPFREEKNPSMTFIRMGDGSILWRDWGDSIQSKPESVIKFVMRCYECSWYEALDHIKDDMGSSSERIMFVKKPRSYENKAIHKEIQIHSRNFDKNDEDYWGQYGISISTLNLYNVIPVQTSYYGIYPMMSYDGLHPLYAYKLYHNGNIYYKIYNPLTTNYKDKWKYNGTKDILLGYDQLQPNGYLLILTKSLKDVMVLHEMGYNSVSLQSEATELNLLMYETLIRRFDNIVVFYDNDSTGIKRSEAISRAFGLPYILLPKGTHIKDISDYVSNNNIEKGKIMMKEMLDKIGFKV